MLNWTERIIRMRKEVPEIGWGRFHRPNLRVGATYSNRTHTPEFYMTYIV